MLVCRLSPRLNHRAGYENTRTLDAMNQLCPGSRINQFSADNWIRSHRYQTIRVFCGNLSFFHLSIDCLRVARLVLCARVHSTMSMIHSENILDSSLWRLEERGGESNYISVVLSKIHIRRRCTVEHKSRFTFTSHKSIYATTYWQIEFSQSAI